MKKVLLVIILIILSIVIIKIAIGVNENNKLKRIKFQIVEYESIDNIVFYDKNVNITDEDKINFKKIALVLKEKRPGEQIAWNYHYDGRSEDIYEFTQFFNGCIICNTKLYISSIGSIIYESDRYISNIEIKEIKITYEEAEKIFLNYLSEYKSDFNEMSRGISSKADLPFIVELQYYNGNIVYNIQMMNYNDSRLKIDANSGKIVERNFFSGIDA